MSANRFNMTGRLKVNLKRRNEMAPHFNGVTTINDISYWVSAWRKLHPNTGLPYYVLKLTSQQHDNLVIGQGELLVSPNDHLTGKIVLTEDYDERAFKLKGDLNRGKAVLTFTVEKSALKKKVSIELLPDDYRKLAEIGIRHNAQPDALVSRLVKNFLEDYSEN